jgi:hypothetical protein
MRLLRTGTRSSDGRTRTRSNVKNKFRAKLLQRSIFGTSAGK